MRTCWTYSPTDRISFRSIVDELVAYENDDFHQHAYYHTQPQTCSISSLADSQNNDEEELLLADQHDDDDDEQKSV